PPAQPDGDPHANRAAWAAARASHLCEAMPFGLGGVWGGDPQPLDTEFRSGFGLIIARAYNALQRVQARVDPNADTIPSVSRQRRSKLQQAGLFLVGVGLGVACVVITDFDRALRGHASRRALHQGQVLEEASARRIAHHPYKELRDELSMRAIPAPERQ